jgi:hypothetical protein
MSEKAVSDDLEALIFKFFLACRQPWWRLVLSNYNNQLFFPSYATEHRIEMLLLFTLGIIYCLNLNYTAYGDVLQIIYSSC